MKEARLYKTLEQGKVRCLTCAHRCVIGNGKRGVCGVRENRDGKLYTLVFGKLIAMNVDPIEKKPLFHFYPGTRSFSIATVGCNMHCLHCQNSNISQMPKERGQIEGSDFLPEDVVKSALKNGCKTIAYTYTEPTVYWDFAFECSRLAHEHNIKNIFVTNGYLSKESLNEIAPFLDGANVDLKSFKDKTYRTVCGARLKPVLNTIQNMKRLGIWIEVTTLLIPDLNDSDEELNDIAVFLRDLDPGIPWHITRFYPTYRMTDRRPTDVEALRKAREIGFNAGIRYVYTGNVPGEDGEATFCHSCGARLIHRWGFDLMGNRITEGRCPECGAEIDGVW